MPGLQPMPMSAVTPARAASSESANRSSTSERPMHVDVVDAGLDRCPHDLDAARAIRAVGNDGRPLRALATAPTSAASSLRQESFFPAAFASSCFSVAAAGSIATNSASGSSCQTSNMRLWPTLPAPTTAYFIGSSGLVIAVEGSCRLGCEKIVAKVGFDRLAGALVPRSEPGPTRHDEREVIAGHEVELRAERHVSSVKLGDRRTAVVAPGEPSHRHAEATTRGCPRESGPRGRRVGRERRSRRLVANRRRCGRGQHRPESVASIFRSKRMGASPSVTSIGMLATFAGYDGQGMPSGSCGRPGRR